MTVYGFVGASGTGKSHRALEVAQRLEVPCILDDGLLIKENVVLAGVSAKREASRIASIRRALYTNPAHAGEIRAALDASGAESVMVLGTSKHMVDEIAKRLDLPPIARYISIEEVASRSDIDAARSVRFSEGKHVIPAPTFALKKEFSGYFLTPLKRLVRRGRRIGGGHVTGDYGERTVVRPTFSYLGNYTISRAALVQLVCCIAVKSTGILRVTDADLDLTEGGLEIRLSVCVRYGIMIRDALYETADRLRYEIDRQTSLIIYGIELSAKSMEMDRSDAPSPAS